MRIKTLAEISAQYDRISDCLTARKRYASACNLDRLYNCIFSRVADLLGIVEIDDESIELMMNEPLIVGEY